MIFSESRFVAPSRILSDIECTSDARSSESDPVDECEIPELEDADDEDTDDELPNLVFDDEQPHVWSDAEARGSEVIGAATRLC